MPPKLAGFIMLLGVLLVLGINVSQIIAIAVVILIFVCAFQLILRGKWLPQFWGSLLGLMMGPCIVAVILQYLFAQFNFRLSHLFSLNGKVGAWLVIVLCLVSFISYFIVKKRLRFLQQGPPPVTNERQPIYAPRRRALPEE